MNLTATIESSMILIILSCRQSLHPAFGQGLVEGVKGVDKTCQWGGAKCTTREVIGQRKCPGRLFGRSVTEAGWQQAGRVSEDGFWRDLWVV